jgi:carbamate kinase
VEAAVSFVTSGPNREALITELEKGREGILGLTGTRIHA